MKNTHNTQSRGWKMEDRGWNRAVRAIVLSIFYLLSSILVWSQTTPVLFPINSLFGGAAYNRPITLTAANTLISDGQNLWAGTYTIIPASITNPIVSLYPNTYLMTVAGVVKPARFAVPASATNNAPPIDVTTLLTSGPIFYFGGSGLANLLAGTNIVFVTNTDGSVTINSSVSAWPGVVTDAAYATNAGSAMFAALATNAAMAQYASIAGLATAYFGNLGLSQITNAGNAAYGNTNFMKVAGATNADFAALAGGISGRLALANLPAAVLTNGQSGVTLSGTFSGDGSGLLPPPQVVTNGEFGVTLFGAFIGDGSGLYNLNALTNYSAGVALSGAFAGAFSGNGSGLTNLNARALIISNTVAIFPHVTGTNVFWSTMP
jgi:hypothetical protein